MRVIVGSLEGITGQVPGVGARLFVSAPEGRPGSDSLLIFPGETAVPVTGEGGEFSFEAHPGPLRVRFDLPGVVWREGPVITVTVPDGEGSVELATLWGLSVDYRPPVVSTVADLVQQALGARADAVDAAQRAESAATGVDAAAGAAAGSASAASGSEAAAAGSATDAAGSATDAAGSATDAGSSASAAAGSASTASGHADTATTQAGIATGAATSATGAASDAAGHANAAAGSAAAASGSAVTADTKAGAAAGSATTAEQYAQQVVDALANAQAYQDVLTAIGTMSADWQADIAAAIADLVGQAPETLDSIHEMAAALGNDPNFYTTMMTALGERVKNDDPRLNDARVPTAHDHTIVQVTGLGDALDGKSGVGHSHTWEQVTGKPGTFPSTIALVGGLQAALDGKSGTGHTHTKAQVGLGNVDNTSDAAKPVSTATQAALTPLQNRVGAAPATWRWNGTTLPTAASQVHAQARAGDFIVCPNLTTDPGWHQITGV